MNEQRGGNGGEMGSVPLNFESRIIVNCLAIVTFPRYNVLRAVVESETRNVQRYHFRIIRKPGYSQDEGRGSLQREEGRVIIHLTTKETSPGSKVLLIQKLSSARPEPMFPFFFSVANFPSNDVDVPSSRGVARRGETRRPRRKKEKVVEGGCSGVFLRESRLLVPLARRRFSSIGAFLFVSLDADARDCE